MEDFHIILHKSFMFPLKSFFFPPSRQALEPFVYTIDFVFQVYALFCLYCLSVMFYLVIQVLCNMRITLK